MLFLRSWAPSAVAIALLAAPPARGEVHTWTGANSSLWSDPGNWAGGSPAGDANAVLVFPADAVRRDSTDDLGVATYASRIDVAGGYTLTAAPGSSLALTGDVRWIGMGGSSSVSIPVTLHGGVAHSFYAPGGLSSPWGTLVLDGGLGGSAPDSLVVQGDGGSLTVVLHGTNPFSGSVGIVQAELEVNGTLAASEVAVALDASAELRGTGSLAGNVTVAGGRLRPGTESAPGILSLDGDLSMTSGRFSVRLDGTTAGAGHDQLRVGGSSGVGGTQLEVVAGFVPAIGAVFTIVDGTGPLSGGGFASPVYTPSCLAFEVGTTATSVLLTRVAGGPPLTSVTISSAGVLTTYCNGTGGTATVTDGGGCGNAHQWGFRTVSGGAITDVAGATGPSYTVRGPDYPGPGTYFLVETTTPSGNAPTTSNELTVTVLPAAPGVATGSTTICAGQEAPLYATGGQACSWSPATGLSDPGSCDPVASPASTTTYTVTFSGACPAQNQPSATVTVVPQPSARLYAIAPCRAVDTRLPPGPLEGPALAAWESRPFPLTSACGISPAATAVAANVTVVQPGASGDLRVFPANVALPLASAVAFRAGDVRAGNAVIGLPCDGSGLVRVLNESAGSTHVVVDVVGYFE
ncbi:hypothetical protein FBQ97_00435 [Acidobacteria bacterium ACD]|nr:MAG: hypothetical protein EDX89_20280 [Acidobacteriota bacterium]MDL1948273.1 hypothetical protein [Acidobacteria bacterium ACD]